ncbi:hypothetical protein EDD15DRAFT_1611832 [Pisolithus albus]|nr:hypothetical protein EDD15DRAFT_1611832 [Pisolithus albus]
MHGSRKQSAAYSTVHRHHVVSILLIVSFIAIGAMQIIRDEHIRMNAFVWCLILVKSAHVVLIHTSASPLMKVHLPWMVLKQLSVNQGFGICRDGRKPISKEFSSQPMSLRWFLRAFAKELRKGTSKWAPKGLCTYQDITTQERTRTAGN